MIIFGTKNERLELTDKYLTEIKPNYDIVYRLDLQELKNKSVYVRLQYDYCDGGWKSSSSTFDVSYGFLGLGLFGGRIGCTKFNRKTWKLILKAVKRS